MFNFKLIFVVIFLFKVHEIRSQISDKRLCANENCTKQISLAKTLTRYASPDRQILSFPPNIEVKVYSKSAGSNLELWGVEIDGKRGYAPKRFLRETKVFTKHLPFLLDTEFEQVPLNNSDVKQDVKETIKANKVPEYDVVDGTTIYYTPGDSDSPTTAEATIQATITTESDSNIARQDGMQTVPRNDNVKLEQGDRENEKGDSKESLVENVFQSISNWMNDKDENTNNLVEDEDGDDSTDDYDEDDEYDDTDDEDSEEIDDDTNSNVETNELSSTKQANIDEVDADNFITKENINSEDIVKSRQLLEEKGTLDNPLDVQVDDISTENENVETEVLTEKINEDTSSNENLNTNESIKESGENVTTKQCLDESCLNNEDVVTNNEENLEVNDEITTTNENDIVETTTEGGFAESEFEVPVPNNYVTPNSVEIDQNVPFVNPDVIEQVSESIVIDDNTNTDRLGETNRNENIEPSIETTNNLEIKEINVDDIGDENKAIINKIDNIASENTENLSPSLSETVEQVGENNETVAIKSDEILSELDSVTHNTDDMLTSATPEKHLDNIDENIEIKSQNVLDVENFELPKNLEDISVNLEHSSESFNGNQENNLNDLEDIEHLNQQNNIEENKLENIAENNAASSSETSNENQENNSGVLTGIYTNWFGSSRQDANIESEIQKEENQNSINEEAINKDRTEQFASARVENVDAIEKHDHSFLTVIGKQKEEIHPESSQSEQKNIVSEIDVPTTEIIPEEFEKSDLPPQEIDKQSQPRIKQDVILDEISKDYSESVANPQMSEYHDHLLSKNSVDFGSCPAGEEDCPVDISVIQNQLEMEEVLNSSNLDLLSLLTVLGITGLSIVLFLLGYITIDKNRKEGPLIAKINTLEKALLVASKENEILADEVTAIKDETASENDRVSNEELQNLKEAYQEALLMKAALEDQIQSLEKELENSTEVGLEMNRMLSDILSSQNGSETLIANVEQLQRQLVEQQDTINSVNDTLNLKDTENHELQLELEIKNKKVTHLQAELDKMAMNLFKVEEDKEQMQAKLESEIIELKDQLEKGKNSFNNARTKLLDDINVLKTKYAEVQRNFELKTNEYAILKENFNKIKAIKNNTEALESLLNASAMKAELQQLQRDSQSLNELLKQEQQTKFTLEKQIEIALQEAQSYKTKYDESDKEKLQALTKLEVLSNYFKEKEAQLQKELSKQESMWIEQQGEATSTVERIKYMQEELQNCKSQNELLKQEIVSQEVELKSQISVLEKKAHESWVFARQAERRLDDAKQEAAQLRNRLTLKERSYIEDKGQNRLQSPLEQNGDVGLSPLHMPVESPASPPLLYGTRDHITTSPPPLPNMPPFLPPPPGVPFMPPPIPGVPGFMPPPPSMFSVDHRPPPLGRMSSPPPPLNSRYSPDSRYSPYDRNSPSPPYDDEYGSSPPPLHRGYSPYNNRDDRREYKRPPPVRTNGRNKGISSGSGNSNESLEKINRHHSKV